MAHADSAETVSARVEQLLDAMQRADPRARQTGEELVRTLMSFYGAGLERIVEAIGAAPACAELLDTLTADELVGGLLVLHDLHPADVTQRVQGALEQVRPYLGSHAGDVALLGVEDGVAHLRLQGSCDGCPSSAVTVKLAIEQAIQAAAPEVSEVEVEGVVPESPAPDGRPSLPLEPVEHGAGAQPQWVTMPPAQAPAPGELAGATLAGTAVAVGNLDGALYAYRDTCPACHAPISAGELAGVVLTCPGCGQRYDLQQAGRAPGTATLHLWPLPLLADREQVRVALDAQPAEVRA